MAKKQPISINLLILCSVLYYKFEHHKLFDICRFLNSSKDEIPSCENPSDVCICDDLDTTVDGPQFLFECFCEQKNLTNSGPSPENLTYWATIALDLEYKYTTDLYFDLSTYWTDDGISDENTSPAVDPDNPELGDLTDEKPPTTIIVGIIIGVVVAVGLIVLLAVCLVKKWKNKLTLR